MFAAAFMPYLVFPFVFIVLPRSFVFAVCMRLAFQWRIELDTSLPTSDQSKSFCCANETSKSSSLCSAFRTFVFFYIEITSFKLSLYKYLDWSIIFLRVICEHSGCRQFYLWIYLLAFGFDLLVDNFVQIL